MDEVALIVIGALVGAPSAGGVGVWDAWWQRRNRRRVAARLLLGDPYLVESAAELILKARRWPDFYDYQQQLDTWREVRADFADGVEAWEWALVDRAYAHLLRTSLIARPGEPCTPGHLDVITEMRQRAVRARAVVLERSASQRALEHLVKVLGPGPEETTK